MAERFEQLSSRSLKGWYLYDWANSAFATVILAALLPVYFADGIVPPEGVRLFGVHFSATSLWGYVSGLSALLVFLVAPLLGSLADLSNRRRQLLIGFFLPGSIATLLMIFVGPGDVTLALTLYLIAASTFVAANIFYDSFLPYLGPPSEHDRISARGYAWGYFGGGLIFLLDLILVQAHGSIGLSKVWAVRIALASAGAWWLGFGLMAWLKLEEPTAGESSNNGPLLRAAITRTWRTIREAASNRQLALFLLAFLFYNDGIQTVVKMASIYGKEDLGFSTGTLLGTLLLVQIVGIFGALLFGRLGPKIGSRRALMLSLFIWIGVVIWGWRIQSPWEFWALGAAVGFCLGGTQALSRSYFASYIPAGRSAEYYGFYSVFAKFSAIGGPILFALVRQLTGTARLSILALGAFFIIGIVLLTAMGSRREI